MIFKKCINFRVWDKNITILKITKFKLFRSGT